MPRSSPSIYIAVLCCLAFASIAKAGDPVSVPFEISPRGHVMVPVTIGDSGPFLFSLDTGTGKTTVQPRVVKSLKLELSKETETVAGQHGQSEQATVILRDLSMAGATKDEIVGVSMDLDHITQDRFEMDGILGADYLQDFDIRIDFQKMEVTLFDRAESAKNCDVCPDGARAISFESRGKGHMIVPASIGETAMTGVLDTGSGHSGINSLAAEALGIDVSMIGQPAASGHHATILAGPINAGEIKLQDRVQLGIMDRKDIFKPLGLDTIPRILMGTNLFEGRTLSISYGLNLLFVE